MLAKALGKPVILGSCSIGPFDPGHDQAARRALALADVVITRERWSHDECLRLGVPQEKIVESPDLAFLFTRRPMASLPPGTQPRDNTVGVSVLEHTFPGSADPKDSQRAYLSAVADALAHLRARFGAEVTIIPQTAMDIRAGDHLGAMLADRGIAYTNLREDFTPDELRALYGGVKLLVGTRMHGNILAMSACTPVAAISYMPKTAGILRAMDLADWYVDIECLGDGALTDLVERQWVAASALDSTVRSRALGQADAAVSAGIAARQLISYQSTGNG